MSSKMEKQNKFKNTLSMKKTALIFIALACIAGSCRQAENKQKQAETPNICQGDTLIKLSETHGILFQYYDVGLELWYKPRIVDFRSNDTVIIQNLAYENGSELDIRVSPNKKYVVIDNIIKGYVAQEMYENYQCVLIDIDNAILLYTWQSDCSGEWDKNSNWISGDKIVFPHKKEETSEKEYFVVESDWQGVICKEYQEDGVYTNIQDCTFPNANLQQVYDIVKNKVSDLKTELPANNLEYGNLDDEDVIVTYTYKEPKHLHVELFYRGGVTTVEIIEKEKETQTKIVYSAD